MTAISLAPGVRLGPYEIRSPLGAGGMGEVYLADDPRLGRQVAIKVLPAAADGDPERLRRFEIEARAVSALNHPNILTIHDLGREGATPYLVSELLEGQTLRERLSAGPLTARKAVDLAAQLARGLAAAHARGVVHRDLKPENLFVCIDGRLKILDFGLAKLRQPARSASLMAAAPTIVDDTTPGSILGTVGYMAPEQVRGQELDHRADIFAFGAILFEMLTGLRAFQRDSAVETMSAILREDPPDPAAAGRPLPPALGRIVHHCLEKEPRDRFQAASDLAFDLDALTLLSDAATSPTQARPGATRASRWRPVAAGAVLALAGVGVGAGLGTCWAPRPASEPPMLRILTASRDDWAPTASPDGKLVAFVSDRDGRPKIWLKQLAGGGEVALTGGEDSRPVFSPDGASVLYTHTESTRRSLWRVATLGGAPHRIADDVAGGTWSPDGRQIAFIGPRSEASGDQHGATVWTMGVDGGQRRQLLDLELTLTSLRWSPDGQRLAAVAAYSAGATRPVSLLLIDATSGRQQELAPAYPSLISAIAWNGPDELLYIQPDSVTDINRSVPCRVIRHPLGGGRPQTVLVLPRVADDFTVLGAGRLVLDLDTTRQSLSEISVGMNAGIDSGPNSSEPRRLTGGLTTDRQPVYTADGKSIVFASSQGSGFDLWQLSRDTGALSRLTDDPADDWDPAVTADGRHLLWSSNRSGHFEIWSAAADGSGPHQLSNDGFDAENPTVTADGAWVVYTSSNPAKLGLWVMRFDGSDARRVVAGPAIHPEVSPDGIHALYFTQRPGQGRILHVVRLADGSDASPGLPELASWRARWLSGGAIAYVDGLPGPGHGLFRFDYPVVDLAATRQPLALPAASVDVDSFAVAPDGLHIALSEIEWGGGLLLAEGVPGVRGPAP